MGTSDWNWRLPVDPQDYPFDCAATSTAWCLRSIGRTETEQDVIAGLGASRITAEYGLMDASGAGLVEYLGELGITAANNSSASWFDVTSAAGFQPMVIGGRVWCHWVAVRMGTEAASRMIPDVLALMNSADDWMGVHQVLEQKDFVQLGEFSAVWFVSW
jgi:hypothetical protein